MRVLAAVDTVHTAAALCDYLDDRLDAEDEVVAVSVDPSQCAEPAGESDAVRDGREALNVVAVRLVLPSVETVERRGDPAPELVAAAEEQAVDEIVLGGRAGTPGTSGMPGTSGTPGMPEGVGSTAEAVLASTTLPVVVIPLVGV